MACELTAFAYHEARLLDEWRLDDWAALFAEDGVYWLPMDEDSDPTQVPSILFDDLQGIKIRVEQLMRQNRISQQPRCETLHLIGNLEVEEGSGNTAVVRYNVVVHELRTGDWRQYGLGDIHQHPGRVTLKLAREGDSWKIREKKLVLLARHRPLEAMSYLF